MSAAENFTSDGDSIEKRSEKVFFTYGRFQPPTIGHRMLVESVASAAATAGADAYVFATSTQDSKRNPLTVGEKVYWMKKVFVGIPIRIINTTVCKGASKPCRTIPEILGILSAAGYSQIEMFVGSDRTEDFRKFVPASIPIHSTGEERDEAAEGIVGMSGTKLRNAAVRGNLSALKNGTGLSNNNAGVLADHIRHGLKKGGRRKGLTRRKRRTSVSY
jgi:hypothetical protein